MAQFISADGKVIWEQSKKRTLIIDDVEYKRVPKPKYKSRATRCSEACGTLQEVVDEIDNSISELESLDLDVG